MRKQLIIKTIITTLILSSFALMNNLAYGLNWQQDGFRFGVDSSLTLSASWRIQERDNNNISFGNTDSLIQIGDPIVALRFLQPSLEDKLGTLGLPQAGEYAAGAYAIADPQVCEDQGLSVSGVNACWLPYFPNGPGDYNENTDDGNLNFDVGVFSKQYRSNHDFVLEFDGVGFFGRLLLFYDQYMDSETLPHKTLTAEAQKLVGKDARLLERYFYADLYFGEMPFSLRVGSQVISWGESGFISGINIFQNARDFNQLLMSGGDLKQGYIPSEAAWLSIGLSETLNLEAYLKTQWQPNALPPAGSYFSGADIVGAGGDLLCINGGMLPDGDDNQVCVSRTEDRLARDGGEFGVKLNWYVPALNNTEFGLYYLRYHSPYPVMGANEGIPDTRMPEQLQAHYYFQYPEDLSLMALTFNTVLPWGTSLAGEFSYRKDVPLSVDIYEILGSAVGNLINLLQFDSANGGQIGSLLSRNDLDLLQLSALLRVLAPQLIGGPEALDIWLAQQPTSDFRDKPDEGNACQIGDVCYPPYQIDLMPPLSGYDIPTYIERDIIKASLLGIHAFSGDWIGASQALLIAELGAIYILDHPGFDELRLLTPGTQGRGVLDPIPSLRGLPCCDRSRWSDEFAWGYAIRVNADYNDMLDGYTITPSVLWQHDVYGTSPSGSAGFVEGVKLLRTGVQVSNKSAAELALFYNAYFGAEQANKLHDRDFISLSLGYSF